MSDDLALQQFDTRAQSAQTHCQTPRSQVTVLLLVILLLASFGLRVYRLGDKSVWWDEGLAAWAARRSLAEIARWTAADVHPPLYFWMLHFWRWGSGDSEFGLRLLYEQPVTEYQSGDTIHLFLYWDGGRVANEPDAGFEVSLADRGGRPWKRVETYVHNLQWHVTWCSPT